MAVAQTTQPDAMSDEEAAAHVEAADDAMTADGEHEGHMPPPNGVEMNGQSERGALFEREAVTREQQPSQREIPRAEQARPAAPSSSAQSPQPSPVRRTTPMPREPAQPSPAAAATNDVTSDDSPAAAESTDTQTPAATTQPSNRASVTATTQPAASARVIPPPKPWSHYRVLAERNMFTRTQATARRPSTRDQQASTQPATTQPSRPRSSWILTGVVLYTEGPVAFFENSVSGMTMRVTVGQEIGSFKLHEVGDDHVKLQDEAQQISSVPVGQSIDGSDASLSATPRNSIFGDGEATSSDSGQSAEGGSGNRAESGSEANMSVAERMRARRREQMNR